MYISNSHLFLHSTNLCKRNTNKFLQRLQHGIGMIPLLENCTICIELKIGTPFSNWTINFALFQTRYSTQQNWIMGRFIITFLCIDTYNLEIVRLWHRSWKWENWTHLLLFEAFRMAKFSDFFWTELSVCIILL